MRQRFLKPRFIALAILLAILLGLFIFWYFTVGILQPLADRVWAEDVAVFPHVTIKTDEVIIEGIRDWHYEQGKVLSQGYIDQTFIPSQISKVWLVQEPFADWKAVAHTLFVFDFSDGKSVAFSIEARKEANEKYAAWEGLWRNFELIYLWGTEQDFINRRFVYFDHEVYKYPLTVTTEFGSQLFLELAKETVRLEESPRFYHTLTSNCTNNLAEVVNQVSPGVVPLFTRARVLPGYTDKFLFEQGFVDTEAEALEEMQEQFKLLEPIALYSTPEKSLPQIGI